MQKAVMGSALILGVCVWSLLSGGGHDAQAGPQKSAYQRVVDTDTIRCGFQYWDGGVMRNEETGELEGLVVELTNKISEIGNVKIEWVGPIGWGNVQAELTSGKIDMMCAGMWQSGQKAKYLIFSEPFAYQGAEAFVREAETRFGKNFEGLNDEAVRIVTIDGDNDDQIVSDMFPSATKYAMPQATLDVEKLYAVSVGKADVAITSPGGGLQFMKENPGKIKRLSPHNYLRVFGLTYVFGSGEEQLARFIETAVEEIENTGYIDMLIDRYNQRYPEMYIKKRKAYENAH
jgi:ABC-type amino acid transport substrate-binding protein